MVAQMELEQRLREAQIKEDETRQLQIELEQTRIQMEENQKALEEALMTQHTVHVVNGSPRDDDDTKSEQSTCCTCRVLVLSCYNECYVNSGASARTRVLSITHSLHRLSITWEFLRIRFLNNHSAAVLLFDTEQERIMFA